MFGVPVSFEYVVAGVVVSAKYVYNLPPTKGLFVALTKSEVLEVVKVNKTLSFILILLFL